MIKKIILPFIICLWLSYTGYKDFFKYGLADQKTHITMTELGLMNYKNSGVVWYGCYSYFNENPVTDLMYKVRDCKQIKNRNEFYPGHNKYDFMQDTNLNMIVGKLWKPNETEKNYYSGYKLTKYKDVVIYIKK